MPKTNPDLISTKILRKTKNQLEFIKAAYRVQGHEAAKGDAYAIAHLVEQEFQRQTEHLKEVSW